MKFITLCYARPDFMSVFFFQRMLKRHEETLPVMDTPYDRLKFNFELILSPSLWDKQAASRTMKIIIDQFK